MKEIYLICNAHIDPVWLWEWEEGVGTVLTTFTAAANFCDEFDGFVFNHNEAMIYEWVEKYDPKLFNRIKDLVKKGKWNITGGWYLQPDCNMPSGESIVRQILLGHMYFKEKFDITTNVAVNYDSFGHSKGLVQILNDAGYIGYLCCRPNDEITERDFVWRGYNKSEILLHRSLDGYNTLMGGLEEKLNTYIKNLPKLDQTVFLWGVGNHGGGPSRIDFLAIDKIRAENPDIKLINSSPEMYFDELNKKRKELPIFDKELNYIMMGCYTSQSRIKQKHMLLENELIVAEKMSVHSSLCGMEYPRDELNQVVRDLLLSEFHDILPGTSIKEVEDSSLRLLDHALENISRIKLKAFLYLAVEQKNANENEYPIFVYNPHPYPVDDNITCEMMLSDQNWSIKDKYYPSIYYNEEKVKCQLEKESCNVPLDWRKRITFEACLPPFSISRFSCFFEKIPISEFIEAQENINKQLLDANYLLIENCGGTVTINKKTGLVDSYKIKDIEYLDKDSFEISVTQGYCDPWGFSFSELKKQIGVFELVNGEMAGKIAGVKKYPKGIEFDEINEVNLFANSKLDINLFVDAEIEPVRIIENGPVRTIVEAIFNFNNSDIVVHYIINKNSTAMRINIKVYNNEKDVVFKLNVPTTIKNGKYFGKTIYGVKEMPIDASEVVSQEWTVLSNDANAVSLINFGNYGSSCADNVIKATLLNSAAYSAHPVYNRKVMPDDRFSPRMDQGERDFSFIFDCGEKETLRNLIDYNSTIAHQKPFVLNYFPNGSGLCQNELFKISNNKITMTALKKAENSEKYVIRLFNSTDKLQKSKIESEIFNLDFEIELNENEFKSYLVSKDNISICNILEEIINT